jgi:hypothetical protein
MAVRLARVAGRASPARDDAATSVLTAVSAVLLSLALVLGIAGDAVLGIGSSRALGASTMLVLVGRGLYLLFRHRS